ncbi:MAG TPA: hypothetical protein DCX53_10370, partial [Anaerolineae bacterium]|nr:hypothetical protein [Anaerolineae bacterium]
LIVATIKSVISIKSRAFVLKAVTLKNGSQTLHVIAQDQTLQAVPGAVITAIVNLSDGSKQELEFFTNQAGIGQTSFSFSDQKVGELITIDITVSYLGLSTTTTSSFRIWN